MSLFIQWYRTMKAKRTIAIATEGYTKEEACGPEE
jgi:hypothetical protein